MEHMTPVILLTDGFIANGSEAWLIPDMKDYPQICPPIVESVEGEEFKPYRRNEKFVRGWAFPGKKGLEHRIGGLEKDHLRGTISYDAANHQEMVKARAAKVAAVVEDFPTQTVYGDNSGDVLLVGWGGTLGHLKATTDALRAEGKSVSLCHFNYINPLPKGCEEIFRSFKRVIVCELNEGQFVYYLRSHFPSITFEQYNKTEGQPFTVTELINMI